MPEYRRSRKAIARDIQLAEGNIRKAAARMGICRPWLYHYINKYDLWDEVNEARARRIARTAPDDSLLTRARQVLKH